MKKRFELGLDHPVLASAKIDFEGNLKRMVSKAVATGSMEGSATLKISMEIMDVVNHDTGEIDRMPVIRYKTGWQVPIKENVEGKLPMDSQLVRSPDGEWCLINNQISMDELMEEDKEEAD